MTLYEEMEGGWEHEAYLVSCPEGHEYDSRSGICFKCQALIDNEEDSDNDPCGYCGSTIGFYENHDGWMACDNCGGV